MFTLNCKGRLLVLHEPVVMGILNTTPDSFYSGSRQASVNAALEKAEEMLQQGATILDIGGQSTRPGSEMAGTEEEVRRVSPVIAALAKEFPQAFISIDTFHASVATAAVNEGAVMVNDISGGRFDDTMLLTVAALRVPYVCMHLKGNSKTMHQPQEYEEVVKDVLDYFIKKSAECKLAGIHDLVIDPGFGFSKTAEENFALVKYLDVFSILEKPILLGVSRKSSIYKTLGITADEALNGTTVINTAGLLKGAGILRVHDVREAIEAIKLTAFLR